MANQNWVMAGVYLAGLVSSMTLLMSAWSARAGKARAAVSTVSSRVRRG